MAAESVKSSSHRAKIIIIDDHPVFREGIVRIIDQRKDLMVVGEAPNAADAIKLISSLHPDLALVDISMDDVNGIDLTKTLRAKFPKLLILVISMHKETLYAERALWAGANGYIMKRESSAELLSAIHQVLRGEVYVSREMNAVLLQKISNHGRSSHESPIHALTDREFEIYQLIGQGYGTRPIAEKMNISMKTVESHREHIRAKLNLKTSSDLVQHAINWSHHEKAF